MPEKLEKNKLCGRALYNQVNQEYNASVMHSFKAGEECMNNPKQFNQETLDLFPLQPTGNLQSRTASSSSSLPRTFFGHHIAAPSTSSATKSFADQGGSDNQHAFFNFLCGNNGSCDSH